MQGFLTKNALRPGYCRGAGASGSRSGHSGALRHGRVVDAGRGDRLGRLADLGGDFGLVGDNAVVHPCAAGEHAHERRSAQETCKQLLHGYLLHKKFTTI